MQSIFISATGTVRSIDPTGPTFELEELQAMVGGLIEIINLSSEFILVCHDESKLVGAAVNEIATFLMRGAAISTASPFVFLDTVCGDVIFTHSSLVK